MSYSNPFYDFFDAVNNEVNNFHSFFNEPTLDFYAPRRLDYSHGDGKKENAVTKSSRGSKALAKPRALDTLDDWFNNDFAIIPSDFMQTSLTPPVDILDHDSNYELKISVPGVNSKKDINLEYHKEKNEISVSGEVPSTVTESTKNSVKVKERLSGKFSRRISLPKYPGVDADNIKADYSNGVLTLKIPKLEPGKGEKAPVRKIEISGEE